MSAAGCHDNRMDKIWWNEQWMGWPIGPEYAESSNVDNAYRLEGEVLLVVGEMDHNVDPSSTMQVVNQLIKHNKNFELLVVPGMDHGVGRRLRRSQALRFLRAVICWARIPPPGPPSRRQEASDHLDFREQRQVI